MGILDLTKGLENWTLENAKLSPDKYWESKDAVASDYKMTEEEKKVSRLVIRHFTQGDMIMQKPRVEFNDLSVVMRAQYDEMSWNTYQPANGEPATLDAIGGWESNAIRPVVRNKCISIAAHATARLIFPKVFAYNEQSVIQDEAAKVMESLMEYSGDRSNFAYQALNRVIAAEIYPASIGYTEYTEVYRPIKKEKEKNGKWKEEMILDEELSGFQDTTVPVDQLFISNFYEPEIQKQGFIIWRRVREYSLLESIYRTQYPNFKYVKPGVQLVYNDANQSFYQVYDTVMRPEMCEEIIYWNRSQDLKIIMINGVMITDADNPNPRLDKLYPFDKFGYELINNRCFYYKSLAFKMMQDANVVNTLYPMIIDGTYLSLMPPMVSVGGEKIGNEVVVPGLVTNLTDPNSDLRPIQTSNNLKAGMDALFKVEESLNETSQDPQQSGLNSSGSQTAYEISRLEQNANTVLGLFIKMISEHIRQFGKLRMGDILQYMTIAGVDTIGDNKLVYKTFLKPSKGGKDLHTKIKFDSEMPTDLTKEQESEESYKVLDQEQEEAGGKMKLYRVNPEIFRALKFMVTISPDILNPRSEDLERAFKLEIYDRAIANPSADQEAIYKDFLLGAYHNIVDVDKYVMKQQPQQQNPADMAMEGKMPSSGNSPLAAMQKNKLPQSMPV